MARIVIEPAVTTIQIDNSRIYDDASGRPTILRGTTIVDQETEGRLGVVAKWVIALNERMPDLPTVAVIEGGLLLFPRLYGRNRDVDIYVSTDAFRDFLVARYQPLPQWNFVVGDYREMMPAGLYSTIVWAEEGTPSMNDINESLVPGGVFYTTLSVDVVADGPDIR